MDATEFRGIIKEFPGIQVDYFGDVPGAKKPFCYLLSHMHSDHLVGLERGSPAGLVYCSMATRNLVLNLKSKTNQHLARAKQTYAHLRQEHCGIEFLRPMALNYPHEIYLTPSRKIRLTLIDANHCPGSVMFLIENETTAVLYTGDVRAELWYVNALARSPSLVPYTVGGRRLDAIYADTTFAYRDRPYIEIPENRHGVEDLLARLEKYPPNTVFVFAVLTTGYEEVLLAVAERFKTKIHMDPYHRSLYAAIASPDNETAIGASLLSWLTENASDTRFHACDKAIDCPCRHRSDTVFVSPVVAMATEDFEFKNDPIDARNFSCRQLNEGMRSSSDGAEGDAPQGQVTEQAPSSGKAAKGNSIFVYADRRYVRSKQDPSVLLPANIVYRYSRHSSYREIYELVRYLRPKTIYPCYYTAKLYREQGFRIKQLFGDIVDEFPFDDEMERHGQGGTVSPTTEPATPGDAKPAALEPVRAKLFGIRPHVLPLPNRVAPAPLRMRPDVSDNTSSSSQGATKSFLLELLNKNRPHNQVSLVEPLASVESLGTVVVSATRASCRFDKPPQTPRHLSRESLNTVADDAHCVSADYESPEARLKNAPPPRRILKPPRRLFTRYCGPSSLTRVASIERQLQQNPDLWFQYRLAFRLRASHA